MLCSTGLLNIPHATMHLNAGRGDGNPEISAPSLDYRDQEVRSALRTPACGRLRETAAPVDHRGSVIGECAHRLSRGAHPQQHAPHIRMINDRRRLASRRGAERPALHPDSGEVASLLVGAFGDRHTLQPDIEPGGVHHRKHVFEAAILLADAPADSTLVLTIGEDASRRGMYAKLVL